MTPLRRGFVRIPSDLFDWLLSIRLTAVEARVVLWVIRKTLGWNRQWTDFTWYKIAADLQLDRAGILRSGKKLVARGVLEISEVRIGLKSALVRNGDVGHRTPPDTGDAGHPSRRRTSPVGRRAIDSSKDKQPYIWNASPPRGMSTTHLAGAAQPVKGKYDDISTI